MTYGPLSQMWNLTMPSGDVAQAFLSPRITVNYAGNTAIERDVVGDVASFGRQLGILSEAVLELAGPGPDGPKVAALRAIVARVEAVKQRRKDSAASLAKDALDTLLKADRSALDGLLTEFRMRSKAAAATREP